MSDQGAADFLIGKTRGIFRFFPAWRKWEVFQHEAWTDRAAEETLRAVIVDALAQLCQDQGFLERTGRRSEYALNRLLAGNMIEWVCRALAADIRLMATPEERFSEGSQENRGETLFDTPEFILWAERELTTPEGVKILRSFTCAGAHDRVRVRAHENFHRLLYRPHEATPDLWALTPWLSHVYGERFVSLPPSVWGNWPESLTPEWAYRLGGVQVAMLQASERGKLPYQSLTRLLTAETVEWCGLDRSWYPLSFHAQCILAGKEVRWWVEASDPLVQRLCTSLYAPAPAGREEW
jgi:hypothetical protein